MHMRGSPTAYYSFATTFSINAAITELKTFFRTLKFKNKGKHHFAQWEFENLQLAQIRL